MIVESEKPGSPGASPNEVYKVVNLVEYRLPEGYTALTFDDGPSTYTRDIVDILVKHNALATFFFIGKNIGANPGMVKYAAEKGMGLGNHSWSHGNLSAISPHLQKQEIINTNTALMALTGKPVTLFRPPYGVFNDSLLQNLQEQQMKALIWNRDPRDWSAKNKDDVINLFLQTDPSGGIYLLHENPYTLEALPEILDYIKRRGTKLVALH